MASPFPGMNPYLEQPAFWSSFHNRLMVAIATHIAPALRPRYYVEVETRVYMDMPEGELLIGIPDAIVLGGHRPNPDPIIQRPVTRSNIALRNPPKTITLPMPIEVKERYLEVREVGNNRVVTAIELLSPTNKRKGKGRDLYEAKRLALLSSASHFIEIDLLRENPPFSIGENTTVGSYYILVSRASERPQANLYTFTLQDSLPEFLLPLQEAEESIVVDLQKIFEEVCEQASYDLRIDYTQPLCQPALPPEEESWMKHLLAQFHKRQEKGKIE